MSVKNKYGLFETPPFTIKSGNYVFDGGIYAFDGSDPDEYMSSYYVVQCRNIATDRYTRTLGYSDNYSQAKKIARKFESDEGFGRGNNGEYAEVIQHFHTTSEIKAVAKAVRDSIKEEDY